MFLPFTDNGKETELAAIEVKKRLGIGMYDSVNPFDVLDRVPARLVSDEAMENLPEEIRQDLFGKGRKHWSAVGMGPSPITGEELIMLNPTHHPHRKVATLMEEIVHVTMEHPRVRLEFGTNGKWIRPFEQDVEDEAFNVGAACILPYRWLFYELDGGNTDTATMASDLGVSDTYVTYRIKRAGLYRLYRSRAMRG